jgi:hypothetical protein
MAEKVAELNKLFEDWMKVVGAKDLTPNADYDLAEPLFSARTAQPHQQKPSME